LSIKGKEYKTNILTVNVSENKGGIEGEQEEVFVKTVISEDEVFFGQKLILTYELYTRYNIDDMGFPEGITVDGFIQNDIETDSRRGEYVYVEGQNMHVLLQNRLSSYQPEQVNSQYHHINSRLI
jgi:hypothetical protein